MRCVTNDSNNPIAEAARRTIVGWAAVYRLSGAEKANFEPPDAKIGSPVFSNSCEVELLNRIVKQDGQKPKNK
jgi:hypothetical protein